MRDNVPADGSGMDHAHGVGCAMSSRSMNSRGACTAAVVCCSNKASHRPRTTILSGGATTRRRILWTPTITRGSRRFKATGQDGRNRTRAGVLS